MIRTILTTAILLFLCACSGRVNTMSTSNIDPESAPTQKFYIISGSPAYTEAGLEFRTYARMAANALASYGFERVSDPAYADTLIALSYGVGDKQTRYNEYTNTQVFGGDVRQRVTTDKKGRERVVTETSPVFVSSQTRTSENSTYYRWVSMIGLDPNKQDDQGNFYEKWQVETGSRGVSASLPEIMPYMLKSLAKHTRKSTGKIVYEVVALDDPAVAEISDTPTR